MSAVSSAPPPPQPAAQPGRAHQAAINPLPAALPKSPPLGTGSEAINRDTPALLRRWQLIATLACLAFSILTGGGLLMGWQANRDAAADATQLRRVYDIQSDLFRADSLATNAFLVGGLEPPAQRAAYDDAIGQVSTLIASASAAQSADRKALSVLNERVLAYAQGIQQARTYNRQGLPVGAQYLRESSAALRSEVLPVADALVKANQQRTRAELNGHHPIPLALIGIGTLAVLFWINRELALAFRRRINLGVAGAATAIVVISVAAVAISANQDSQHQFLLDNSYAKAVNAADARTAGNDARSQEALKLIARGAVSEDLWVAAADRTSTKLNAVDDLSVRTPWQQYVDGHTKIVTLDSAGNWDGAVREATRTGQGSVTAAFDAFDKAARDLATTSFDEVTAKAGARNGLQFFLAVLSILAGLVGAGLVAWGIGQRRREFA